MAKIERFEDLVVWQKARALTREIYRITKDRGFSTDYSLKDQIRRASGSIMSNVAEGFERGGRAEFHQYLVVAKASCAEVRSQLYIALDAEYLDTSAFAALQEAANEVARILNGLRSAVQRQRDAGK